MHLAVYGVDQEIGMKNYRVIALALFVLCLGGLAMAAPWKFAVLCDSRGAETGVQGSDTGVRTSVLGPMATAMAADGVDLVLFPGDEANGGPSCGKLVDQLKKWKETMAPLYEKHIPIYSFRGNHEEGQDFPPGSAVAAWDAVFPELPQNGPKGQKGLTYKVEHGNALFIGFDQYVGRAATYNSGRYDSTTNTGAVHPWVLQQINAATADWVFAFGHEPAFIATHRDCLANAPAERDALWDALGAKNGIYFSGHDHLYVRRTAPDRAGHAVTECIVGCAGAPFYPLSGEALNADYDRHVVPTDQFVNAAHGGTKNTNDYPQYYGYLLITVDGNTLTGEWKAFVNYDYKNWKAPEKPEFKTLDTFTLVKRAAAVLAK